ncbi:MAG: SDR family oxidoreductase [Mesorhizobium sp.]|uniref:SDR family oxidoreductase n=1 Tax=Mesorhizobium sp. TaxID=1871066 RepID=UPI000FE6EAE6|nr:SDR family NAD(P)-dependent oxidoreductase [Mesorhizobium sp.]RWB32246.1 MAG: SDR family oxidoreductase [Mesorhizobium sp.]RWB82955.1 MAG: SDR family oxidoreductase [Mesorhizobium sp.]RWF78501.1 MAG: SDR family oxidoreductase [Mesorhizobium sp.]TIS68558.1 MAG: SDR family oxidoreductase [Mesorhizobium sp.]
MNAIDLSGQSAVVTGGCSGVGRAIVERLVRSGAEVAVWDVNDAALSELATDKHLRTALTVQRVDVRDFASVEGAAGRLSRVDILVNCAGITGATAAVWDYPEEEWQRVIDVNLHGVFRCCRAVLPSMRQAGYGRIINVASVVGKDPNPFEAAYGASKAGVIAFTKALGRELAETGIVVNCVTPALIDTPLARGLPEDFLAYCLRKIPMNRMGRASEVAAMVAWMASAECSFSTGAVFDLSGGRASY